jgi:hypothetical protein
MAALSAGLMAALSAGPVVPMGTGCAGHRRLGRVGGPPARLGRVVLGDGASVR